MPAVKKNFNERGVYYFYPGYSEVISLSAEQIELLDIALKTSSFSLDGIYVTKDRVDYCFGQAKEQYMYTFNGEPPKYYFKEGDRSKLFPRERHLGGNWYYLQQ
jgi:hypothetical protein